MRHTGDSGGVTSRNYKSVIGETDWLTDYGGFSNLFMDIGHTALFEAQFGEGPWEVGLKLPLENDVIKIHEAGASDGECYSRWPCLLYDTVIVASCVVPNCSDMAVKME